MCWYFTYSDIYLLLKIAIFFRVCFLFVLAFVGVLYPYNRGALCTSFVLVYTLTSVVGGYTTASFHNQFAQTGWVRIFF